MQAKDVKHGMQVADKMTPGIWEVLDRHPRANHWWLHRRDAAGAWITHYAHMQDLQPVGAGSRQESILTEGIAA